MKFIIKLFPEIMVKGNAVKKKMVSQLHDNLRTILHRQVAEIETKRFWDKIEVFCTDAQASWVREVLTKTPGVEQVLTVTQSEAKTLEEIAKKVSETALAKIAGKTFVVRAKRTGTHDFTSSEMERFIGGFLLKSGQPIGVDLTSPEVKIELEYHEKQLNVIQARHKGLGGYPLGSQGEVLSLMSGGFDSTIASYLTLKRGVKTHFIFFNLGGNAHEIGVKQVALYLWSNFASSHRLNFISIPFEEVVSELFRANHESYMGVMLKRLMLMAAEKVANELQIDALVTGEAVAQVSSQTLRNLALIDQASQMLVLRPLAMMDKPDIMRLADKIGTRHFAENMPEYCGVISQNPVTNGSFKRMEREARFFNYEVLENAVSRAKKVAVDQIVNDVNEQQAMDVVTQVTNETVIDIRNPAEVLKEPLPNILAPLIIPFYELNQKFKGLQQNREYLLFCQKGVMSQLHAQYLHDQGFYNVKVYRPERS